MVIEGGSIFMNSVSDTCKIILACGASVSMVILAVKAESSSASNALAHIADAVKQYYISNNCNIA